MNNKESKTYKDMYHFTDKFYPVKKEDAPSLDAEPDINTSIKKNPYRSNVEIEGDEVVLQPDLSALFKAKGKKHSQGGMDVLLQPDSFIFSNDKSLALDKKDCDTFEFKMGGTYSDKNKKYTPAEVLKKNVDIKHYNTLSNNLQDIKKDDLAKQSSALMLEKYLQTIGNLAFVQEGKKGFPQGIPSFAQGAAPVYNTDTKNEIMEQKQYAKYGGKINPYMQAGGYNPFDRKNTSTSVYNPNPGPIDFTQGWGNQQPYMLQPVGPNKPFSRNATPADKSEYMFNDSQGVWYKKIYIDKSGQPMESRRVNLPPASTGPAKGLSGIPPVANPGPPPVDDTTQAATPPFVNYKNIPKLNGPQVSTPGNEIWAKDAGPGPTPAPVAGQNQIGKQVNWNFTPWQKFQLGNDALDYAGIKRYMPFRSRFNPSYVDPSLVNPEQAINDVKSAAYLQSQSANSLSPILRNTQMNSVYGSLLNQLPGIRSQYDNQNVGIINQTRGINTQIANNARDVNMQNDQRYYQQSVVGQQNFDNARAVARTAFNNDLTTYASENQALALQLLAQGPNPAYSYNFKSGNFTRNPQNILDTTNTPQANVIDQLLQQLLPKFDRLDPRTQSSLIRLAGLKGLPLPSSYGFGPQGKKGGKVGRNPYSY